LTPPSAERCDTVMMVDRLGAVRGCRPPPQPLPRGAICRHLANLPNHRGQTPRNHRAWMTARAHSGPYPGLRVSGANPALSLRTRRSKSAQPPRPSADRGDSSQARRWSKGDSNCRSHLRSCAHFLRRPGSNGVPALHDAVEAFLQFILSIEREFHGLAGRRPAITWTGWASARPEGKRAK